MLSAIVNSCFRFVSKNGVLEFVVKVRCDQHDNPKYNEYKLGLSIIFAVYALAMIITGISKKLKHIRIGGIILFGITLCKVLFYDLASLSTISKTVVLIVLGVIMLIASFLYNKFKDSIFGNEAETTVDNG